jgi:hypothetical protein
VGKQSWLRLERFKEYYGYEFCYFFQYLVRDSVGSGGFVVWESVFCFEQLFPSYLYDLGFSTMCILEPGWVFWEETLYNTIYPSW